MRSVDDIRDEMSSVQPEVNEGDRAAEIVWETLQWVLCETNDRPSDLIA